MDKLLNKKIHIDLDEYELVALHGLMKCCMRHMDDLRCGLFDSQWDAIASIEREIGEYISKFNIDAFRWKPVELGEPSNEGWYAIRYRYSHSGLGAISVCADTDYYVNGSWKNNKDISDFAGPFESEDSAKEWGHFHENDWRTV